MYKVKTEIYVQSQNRNMNYRTNERLLNHNNTEGTTV